MTDAWHWKRLGEPYDAHGGIDEVVPAPQCSYIGDRCNSTRCQKHRRAPAALAPAGATIATEAEGQGASATDRRDGAAERKYGGA